MNFKTHFLYDAKPDERYIRKSFFPRIKQGKIKYALSCMNIEGSEKILLTVSRLSSEEKYKGYENALHYLPMVLEEFPDLRYIIV